MKKVYDITKTKVLDAYDLTTGYLKDDTIEIFVPEQQAVEGIYDYKVITEYPNGGKDVEEIVIQAPKEYVAAHTEIEDIFVYVPYTEKELQTIDAKKELRRLQDWFDYEYTYKEQKYRRLQALDILDDDGVEAIVKLKDLYLEAETVRKRIQELENLLS